MTCNAANERAVLHARSGPVTWLPGCLGRLLPPQPAAAPAPHLAGRFGGGQQLVGRLARQMGQPRQLRLRRAHGHPAIAGRCAALASQLGQREGEALGGPLVARGLQQPQRAVVAARELGQQRAKPGTSSISSA
jgi:hypothetical protein